MANSVLLVDVERDGETFIEGVNTRKLAKSGGSVVSGYPLDIMRRLEFLEDGELVDVEIEQRIRIKPDSGELVVENHIPMPESDWLEQLADQLENGIDAPADVGPPTNGKGPDRAPADPPASTD